ncbi:MAG: phosphotransferase, partial [Bacteroidota bacterium]
MKPTFSEADIHALVQEYFQLQLTDLKPLAGEVDLNFRLTAESGDQYVLKISPPDTDPKKIAFERALMEHLAKHDFQAKDKQEDQ